MLKKEILMVVFIMFMLQYLYYYCQFDLAEIGLSVSTNTIVIGFC